MNAVELPRACVAGACGNNAAKQPVTWVSSGAASASYSGNTLTVNQSTENATLNWQSFNISADGKVIFSQPSASSVALNRIFQASPSQIFGSIRTQLNSDPSKPGGQIYLINPNGFLFGTNSSVNAAGILVSTLNMTDAVFQNGVLSATLSSKPALDASVDSSGNPLATITNGNILIQQGATMQATNAGGRILIASSNIDNNGSLIAKDGQVVLAAGDKVYLSASNDINLRGLLVEVDINDATTSGAVINDINGVLDVGHGNATMVGLAVNQQGRISASTSIAQNGSIRLVAEDHVLIAPTAVPGDSTKDPNIPVWHPTEGGTVTLGTQSNMTIAPDGDDATAVDAQTQLPSTINVTGKQVVVQDGAHITAHGGTLNVTATANPSSVGGIADPSAHLRIDDGAVIDVSGSDATASVTQNIVTTQLRGTELADDPQQRNSALRGQTVTFDARAITSDGILGSGLADVSGALANIGKTVAQRTSSGGNINLNSTGDVIVASGATLNVSGGQTTFTGAQVSTSQLITADGKLVDINSASAVNTYAGVNNPANSIKHDRWGVIEQMSSQTGSHYEAGYVQGSSAGSINVSAAASMMLNGTMLGNAVNGPYQRDPAFRAYSSTNADGTQVYATGGQLNVTTTAPINVTLGGDKSNISIADDADVPANLPLTLSTDYLRNGGFAATSITTLGSITVPQSAPLTLVDGSTLELNARQLNINANITDHGGSVLFSDKINNTNFSGGGVVIGDDVQLDVQGEWINDAEIPTGVRADTPLWKNGGTIQLQAAAQGSQLNIGDGVQLLANGGAWLKGNGSVVGGKGGNISLLSDGQDAAFTLGDRVNISGFGVNSASGGTFSLSAGRIEIASRNNWADAQTYDPSAPDSLWYFTVAPALFSDYGFSKFNLVASGGITADQGDALLVDSNTRIQSIVSTLQLSADAVHQHGGGTVAAFTTITTLPDYLRNPSSIALAVSPNSTYGMTVRPGSLDIKQGAVISSDVNSTLLLHTTGASIEMDGSLIAHGGQISASVGLPQNPDGTAYDPGLQVHVGGDAVMDVSGDVIMTPTDTGLRQGKIYDGGSVTLSAQRGSVLIDSGAVINVSGTSAPFDTPLNQSARTYQTQVIASNAGSIALQASDSIGIATTSLFASAGGTNAFGGILSMTFASGPASLPSSSGTLATFYPAYSSLRTIEISSNALPVAGTPGSGLAVINVPQIASGGFDQLQLNAEEVFLQDGINLDLQRRLEINSPLLAMNTSGTATFNSPYVLLGNTLIPDGKGGASSIVNGGHLNINADFIDLQGNVSLQNIAGTTLSSSGDIELIGVSGTSAHPDKLTGSFNTGGDLTLQASRVYAATAAQFAINAPVGTVRIEPGPENTATPLSAASSITINANNITQDGKLLAPFGSITLNADNDLTLGNGSLTSVSAAGVAIPYGYTQNSTAWFYDGGASSIADIKAVPQRTITLGSTSTDSVNIEQGATVDVSGGGDLSAWEWIPGTGGTKDALSNPVNPDLYAIMPSLGYQSAAFDAESYKSSNLQAGDTVYLSGTSNIAAGFYTLLPARYALLPGTYLVSAVPGFTNIQPGVVATLADGTPVVAGYRSFGNSGLGGTTYSGFAIYPQGWANQLAQYQITNASTFFSGDNGSTANAGLLSLITGNALLANGTVKSAGATGGDNATIDVSAGNLEIVGNVGNGSSGAVQIAANVLNDWNAGSLLLGGQHSADGKSISVTADSVTVTDSAQLTGDDVTLVARNQVSIEHGASVEAVSAVNNTTVNLPQTSTISLTGAGADKAAVVSVSDVGNAQFIHDSNQTSTALGTVNLSADSTIASRGALIIDAPGGGTVDGSVAASGATLTLSSAHLVFGDNQAADQLTVNAALLNSLQTADAVNLISTGSIDFTHYAAGGSTLSIGSEAMPLNSITLQAAAINNSGNDSLELHGNNVMFDGLGDATASVIPAGEQSALTVDAQNILVAGKTMTMNGFTQTTLDAKQQVSVADNGSMLVAGGLNIKTARITAQAGSTGSLIATGDVSLHESSAMQTMPSLQLGGALTIAGNNIDDNADIVLPSGIVNLQAANTITLEDAASIDVSGMSVHAAGVRADSSAGAIRINAGGNLVANAGSLLDVAASGDSKAGGLDLQSGGTLNLQSTMNAASSAPEAGGAIAITAGSINDFSSLNDAIQHDGFTQSQSIHVQDGNLGLAAGKQIMAHDVQWITDRGVVNIAGAITAPSTGQRSAIRLYGADGVTVSGSLNADAAAAGNNGGNVEIGVSDDITSHPGAMIDLLQGSVISAKGTAPGGLWLRAPVLSNNDVAISEIAGNVSGTGSLSIEAVLPAYNFSGTVSSAQWSSMQNDAANYFNAAMANAHVQTLLNNALTPVALLPGIEINGSGDIALSTVDLSTWRFNGAGTATAPVALTVRASGSLSVNGNISDGFRSDGSSTNDSSATIRLVAGSNQSSADPLMIDTAVMADLNINSSLVRTGTGNLDLIAARDVKFTGTNPGAYTGGIDAPITLLDSATTATTRFLTDGGQVLINAGRDVIGQPQSQNINAWQLHDACSTALKCLAAQTTWGINVPQFHWNTGTLGGGDLAVIAGRDVNQLTAAAADSAAENADDASMTMYGGGALEVNAGNNINSGVFYSSRSPGRLNAGGSITGNGWASSTGVLLLMDDTQMNLEARSGIAIAGVVNSTTVASMQSGADFFTFGQDSGLALKSSAGNILLAEFNLDSSYGVAYTKSELLPTSLFVSALSGDIALAGDLNLYPSSTGGLNLFAADNIDTSSSANIYMADTDPVLLFTPVNPFAAKLGIPLTINTTVQGVKLLFDRAAIHLNDSAPATIAAGGNISNIQFNIPKAFVMAAGGDISDISLRAQNLNASDISKIVAGGSISLSDPSQNIVLSGPGRIDVLAGGNIDFGVSSGIVTNGALGNPNIPDKQGADIAVLAGMGSGLNPDWDINAFIDHVAATSATGADALVAYVKRVTSQEALSLDQAVSQFKAMPLATQQPFVLQEFYNLLVEAGMDANTKPALGYSTGYAAIDALLPHNRGDNNPYKGNINLDYSQIYTLAGGSINLFAPGGGINVGLAQPPVGVGVQPPGKLGIVTQGGGSVNIFANNDVNVNASRIFTLLGGDINIWSTLGNIDAGRGAKTSISAPPPVVTIDQLGNVVTNFSGAVAGSGIRTIQTNPDVTPGNVNLMAPAGFVDAGDAGIGSSGNINVASLGVIGASNINFGGQASGVPAATSGVGASLSGASAVGGSSDKSVANAASDASQHDKENKAPMAQAALSWLEVFVTGLGEDNCKQDDLECLKKQK